MADGDKIVPSEGNSKLDPTKKSSSGPESVSFARDKNPSRRLEGYQWVKNQSGLLTRRSDLSQNVEAYQMLNRYSKQKNQGVMSVEELQTRGDSDYIDSKIGPKNRGSSKEDEQAKKEREEEEKKENQSYTPPSAPRPVSGFRIPTVGKTFQGMSSLREMMEMPIANVPMIGTGKRYCGPSIVGTMNFTGAAMQTNAPETMTTGGAINTEAVQ
jgi:hypothetical protein